MARGRSNESLFFDIDIEAIVQQVLVQDVAPIAEDILRRHIQSDIYGVYSPQVGQWVGGSTYGRRHVLEPSVTSYMTAPDTLFVTSDASANTSIVDDCGFSSASAGAFLELLASGNMGIWKSGFARDAVAPAQAEADNSSAIRNAINNGVKQVLAQMNR